MLIYVTGFSLSFVVVTLGLDIPTGRLLKTDSNTRGFHLGTLIPNPRLRDKPSTRVLWVHSLSPHSVSFLLSVVFPGRYLLSRVGRSLEDFPILFLWRLDKVGLHPLDPTTLRFTLGSTQFLNRDSGLVSREGWTGHRPNSCVDVSWNSIFRLL